MTTTTTPAIEPNDAATPTQPGHAAVSVASLSHIYPPARKRRSERKRQTASDNNDRVALRKVSLEVQPGEIFGLLGPNGSGKSTLFRILATVQAAKVPVGKAPGTAEIFGVDVVEAPATVRRQIGVVFQHPSLDDKLSAFENLRYHGMLHGLSGDTLTTRCNDMLQQTGLTGRAADLVASFSGGMRRRVEIAKALLTEPKLLLMDEASAGLDPAAQRTLWQTLREQVETHGLTVLLTTHLMHEAQQCDRLAVLDAGRVVAIDTPAGLIDQVGGQVLEAGWSVDNPAAGTELGRRVAEHLGVDPDSEGVMLHSDGIRVELPDAAAAVPAVAQLLGEQADSIRVAKPTLEDAYLKLTGNPLAG
ncbi:MAG: ABC transporter ATP-binding protein [Phycisphaerales bacterium JB063]